MALMFPVRPGIARTKTLCDRQGQTTLFFGAESGRIEVVDYLLDHGAKADVVDDMGRTPSHPRTS
jgi:ankyrin repeat protein